MNNPTIGHQEKTVKVKGFSIAIFNKDEKKKHPYPTYV